LLKEVSISLVDLRAMCALCRREGRYFVPKMKVKKMKSGGDDKKQQLVPRGVIICQPCGQVLVGLQSMSNAGNGITNINFEAKEVVVADGDEEEEEEEEEEGEKQAEEEYVCDGEDNEEHSIDDNQILQLQLWAIGLCFLTALVVRKKMK